MVGKNYHCIIYCIVGYNFCRRRWIGLNIMDVLIDRSELEDLLTDTSVYGCDASFIDENTILVEGEGSDGMPIKYTVKVK